MARTSSKSGKIVRALMTLTGKGSFVFNDRIKNGRSIKVWGWNVQHYEVAMEAMAKQGIKSRLVTTPNSDNPWRGGGQLRIHTQES